MFVDRINLDALEYKQPITQKNGSKAVYVSSVKGSNDLKDRLRFQMSEDNETNLQNAVWGLSQPLAGQDASRRSLELTVESPVLKQFLIDLDRKNIETATTCSELWFKKQLDQPSIESMYSPLFKPRQKETFKDSVKIKVKCADYPTNIWIVDDIVDGEMLCKRGQPEDLTKGIKVLAMVETSGLWFMPRQFGMSLTATDLLIWTNNTVGGLKGFTLKEGSTIKKVVDHPMEDIM